ncbi:hypothetical protein JW796_02770 [Candidatus Dojkabacteria bacterium]|nr:hypothetical protein [Candidatus Dojkabacteria bacterium]
MIIISGTVSLNSAGNETDENKIFRKNDHFICLDAKNSQCREFNNILVELPLVRNDYYTGKFINAAAGAYQLNKIPVLTPGDRIRVIADGYITFSKNAGYVKAEKPFYYASGVCWSTSTLGKLMDEANINFSRKYGLPLFVFNFGDRVPHNKPAKTYTTSNNGYGYAILRTGNHVQDYSFTVNPEIKNNIDLSDLRLRIVMTTSESNPEGYTGKSIGAYLVSNKEF